MCSQRFQHIYLLQLGNLDVGHFIECSSYMQQTSICSIVCMFHVSSLVVTSQHSTSDALRSLSWSSHESESMTRKANVFMLKQFVTLVASGQKPATSDPDALRLDDSKGLTRHQAGRIETTSLHLCWQLL